MHCKDCRCCKGCNSCWSSMGCMHCKDCRCCKGCNSCWSSLHSILHKRVCCSLHKKVFHSLQRSVSRFPRLSSNHPHQRGQLFLRQFLLAIWTQDLVAMQGEVVVQRR